MLNMMIMTFVLICIPAIILFMNKLLSKNMTKSREKKTPFECGFDPMSLSRIPMSTQFFIVGLMFLIFDVEISLLIPLTFMFKKFNLTMIISSMFFILILVLGLLIEYSDQTIEWKS